MPDNQSPVPSQPVAADPSPTQWLIQQQQWHRAEAARFAAGKPDDAKLAAEAFTWITKYRDGFADDYRRMAESGLWASDELSKWDLARVQQLIRDEAEHYRAAVSLLVAFAHFHGIDASPLLDGNDPRLLLRLEALIRTALAKEKGRTATQGEKKPAGRSTSRGPNKPAAELKLIAALTAHHQYVEGGCLNSGPIGCNELARRAGVSAATASAFFTDKFKGYARYKTLCRDTGRLAAAIKLLNDEFAPYHLLGDMASDVPAPEPEDDDSK